MRVEINPIPGVTVNNEKNPFLGERGIRLSLRAPDHFRTQLRALARTATEGTVKVMLPMVTVVAEFEEAREHLESVIRELERDGIAHCRPKLGIMVETPAAALTAESWPVDFYSIGSNDLTQYVTACSRDNPNLAAIADPLNPGVLELIGRTIESGKKRGAEVSVCGEMAADPNSIPALLSLGLEAFSVSASQVGRVKMTISEN